MDSFFYPLRGSQKLLLRSGQVSLSTPASSKKTLPRASLHYQPIRSSSTIDDQKCTSRPVGAFPPSPWGDRFLHYTPDTQVIKSQNEKAKELKEELKRGLLLFKDKPLIEQLRLIDSLERLGVAYHFDKDIENALQCIHTNLANPPYDSLELASLHFRLLRQHGFKVSPDVFEEFICPNGSLKEGIVGDIHGILNLYEACYVRIHGEDILEKALPFIITELNKVISESDDPSSMFHERIKHALDRPLHKRVNIFDTKTHIQFYEEDDLLHNESLLSFAKLNFNLLQASYKDELSQMLRYWKSVGVVKELGMRDKMVECYGYVIAVYVEPWYSLARKINSIGAHVITSVDDFYDAYATLDEMEIFTQAVERWDRSGVDQLPTRIRKFYQRMVLDAHDEMERLLLPVGRSQYLDYAKKELKALCRSYLVEARWRHNKVVPTLDDCKQISNAAFTASITYVFLGVDGATDHEFEWISKLATPVKSAIYHFRILNDLAGSKFDVSRGLSNMFMDCYMKEYGFSSYEEAHEELQKIADGMWKDINEGIIQPSEVALPFYNMIINITRSIEAYYIGGKSETFSSDTKGMEKILKPLFIDSFPM